MPRSGGGGRKGRPRVVDSGGGGGGTTESDAARRARLRREAAERARAAAAARRANTPSGRTGGGGSGGQPRGTGRPDAPQVPVIQQPDFDPRRLQAGRGTNRAPEPDPNRFLAGTPGLLSQLLGSLTPGANFQRAAGAASALNFRVESQFQASAMGLRFGSPPQFDPVVPAIGSLRAAAGGFVGGALETGFAEIERGPAGEQFASFPQRAGDVAGAALAGGIAGGIEAVNESLRESIFGPGAGQQIDIEAPPVTTPWWQDMPGGIGMFAGMAEWMRQGNLLPDITPQIKLALGWSDTDMKELGYVFDEATNKWILPESEDIADAQAGLGGAGVGGGFAPFSFNIGGGGGGGGGGGFSPRPTPRTAQGVGLTNWRI